MKTLLDVIRAAGSAGHAIGHFNFSDSATLRAISAGACKAKLPVIVGTSEGEREFWGPCGAVAAVKHLREAHDIPIFINADHTHSFEKVKEAVEAGYDAILFDAGKLSLEENIRETKRVVEYVRKHVPGTLVEGELGYIGSSSEVHREIPAGAAVRPEDLTKPEDAARFVEETGVNLLAPAVGNIHGIVESGNPRLDIERIKAIAAAVKVPLVLHGGSGISDSDFRAAIEAGIRIIHISTELRVAWRKGVEGALKAQRDEVAPYKLLAAALDNAQKIVYDRLTLFARVEGRG